MAGPNPVQGVGRFRPGGEKVLAGHFALTPLKMSAENCKMWEIWWAIALNFHYAGTFIRIPSSFIGSFHHIPTLSSIVAVQDKREERVALVISLGLRSRTYSIRNQFITEACGAAK